MAWRAAYVLLATATLVGMLINWVRIGKLDAAIVAVAATEEAERPDEIESILLRGINGDKMPKIAYWLRVYSEDGKSLDLTRTTPVEILRVYEDEAYYPLFLADFISRVRYIYRTDQNVLFRITESESDYDSPYGRFELTPTTTTVVRFLDPSRAPEYMTIIGVPLAANWCKPFSVTNGRMFGVDGVCVLRCNAGYIENVDGQCVRGGAT